jgi:hypothetical protein
MKRKKEGKEDVGMTTRNKKSKKWDECQLSVLKKGQ